MSRGVVTTDWRLRAACRGADPRLFDYDGSARPTRAAVDLADTANCSRLPDPDLARAIQAGLDRRAARLASAEEQREVPQPLVGGDQGNVELGRDVLGLRHRVAVVGCQVFGYAAKRLDLPGLVGEGGSEQAALDGLRKSISVYRSAVPVGGLAGSRRPRRGRAPGPPAALAAGAGHPAGQAVTATIDRAAVVERIDPAEFPNCVALLARARYLSALGLPDPVGALDRAAAAAIDTSSDLIRLSGELGWDDAVRQAMADLPVIER